MDHKSKYTASEIDAKLSQVFDSTLQTKEVEVSADATITPDEGFLGLKEVNVKVQGGSGGSDWRYYTSDTPIQRDIIGIIAHKIKYRNGNISMAVIYFGAAGGGDCVAIAYDASTIIKDSNGTVTFQDSLDKIGFSEELMTQFGLKRITEEEFYA